MRRTGATPRVDYQLSANHTLTVRYSFNRDDVQNNGIGGLNLVSRGYHSDSRSQTVQVTETAVLSTSVINETRFQYFRPTSVSQANTPGFALQVLGAFNGGSAQLGHTTDTQNSYELQNYTTVIRGPMRGGLACACAVQPMQLVTAEFWRHIQVLDGSGQPVLVNISSIESYRRTLLFQQLGIPIRRSDDLEAVPRSSASTQETR